MHAAIVQARFGSTRLPGKVLEDIAGRSVLSHVIARCSATRGIDTVCCAIPDSRDSDKVAHEAEQCGASVVRGSESDVLGRFKLAADEIGATVIMRVTSDCPLSDPGINSRVLDLLTTTGADYACNNMPAAWPHGLDCEVFTRSVLNRAVKQAGNSYEREHVTPWMRTHPEIKRATLPGPGGKLSSMRWTLDFPEDLEFFRAVFSYLPTGPAIAGYDAVMAVISEHPEIAAINAHHSHADQPSLSTS